MGFESLIASGTVTRKEENQDCVDHFEGESINFAVVADGLGTYTCAKLSSQKVVEYFLEKATHHDSDSHFTNPKIKYKEVFKDVRSKLIEFATTHIKENNIVAENVFGTTAITLIETSDKLIFNYVGNGGIWHLRGSFNEFNSPYLFPWNSINILNPHSLPQNGKEALYRLMSDSLNEADCVPTTIEINKDEEFGDIFLLCTDGVSSADQIKAGKNDKGVWTKYEDNILMFNDWLKLLFSTHETITNEILNIALQEYLLQIKPTLEDDASVVVLITKRAMETNKQYFRPSEDDKIK